MEIYNNSHAVRMYLSMDLFDKDENELDKELAKEIKKIGEKVICEELVNPWIFKEKCDLTDSN